MSFFKHLCCIFRVTILSVGHLENDTLQNKISELKFKYSSRRLLGKLERQRILSLQFILIRRQKFTNPYYNHNNSINLKMHSWQV